MLDAWMVAAMIAGSVATPLAEAAFGLRISSALLTAATVAACVGAARVAPMSAEFTKREPRKV
jgi:hypothetical protein